MQAGVSLFFVLFLVERVDKRLGEEFALKSVASGGAVHMVAA